jgi:cytochrome c oxidase subunit 2
MSTIFLIVILLLGFLITFQIAKASEYVGVLKGEKKNFEQNNRINGFLLLAFLILGLVGVYWCNELFKGKILGEAASVHGEKIDLMLYITLAVTGVVFVITQIILFWFAFKYQYSEKRKAYYFPHNNKLEVIWTVVPAIALTVLVGFGLYYWFKITGDAPKDSIVVEITGSNLVGSIATLERIMFLEEDIIRILMTLSRMYWVWFGMISLVMMISLTFKKCISLRIGLLN